MKTGAFVLALTCLVFCGCEGGGTDPADNVATPSEAARTVNQNPSSPTVDVPNTPRNEAAGTTPGDPATQPEG